MRVVQCCCRMRQEREEHLEMAEEVATVIATAARRRERELLCGMMRDGWSPDDCSTHSCASSTACGGTARSSLWPNARSVVERRGQACDGGRDWGRPWLRRNKEEVNGQRKVVDRVAAVLWCRRCRMSWMRCRVLSLRCRARWSSRVEDGDGDGGQARRSHSASISEAEHSHCLQPANARSLDTSHSASFSKTIVVDEVLLQRRTQPERLRQHSEY